MSRVGQGSNIHQLLNRHASIQMTKLQISTSHVLISQSKYLTLSLQVNAKVSIILTIKIRDEFLVKITLFSAFVLRARNSGLETYIIVKTHFIHGYHEST